MRKALSAWLVLVLLAGLVGCGGSTALKAVYHTVRGGVGSYDEIEAVQNLDAYGTVEVGDFGNDIGPLIAPGLLAAIKDACVTKLMESGQFAKVNGRASAKAVELSIKPGKTLVIRGRVIDMETGGAAGKAIGDGDRIISRITLRDGGSGASLGRAIVRGKVKGARPTSEVAKGLAAGLEKMIKDNKTWIEM